MTAKSQGGGITQETIEKRGLLRRDVVVENTNSLTNIAVGGIAAKLKSKGAGKVSVNIPLEDFAGIEDTSKTLRKGVTIRTKSGQEYDFTTQNPEEIVSRVNRYIS